MSDQIIPLDTSPNQSFKVTVTMDGKLINLGVVLRYNEVAQYWVMTLRDADGNLLLDSVPLLTGDFPAANLLEQFQYLGLGSAYVINASGVQSPNYPDNTDLGTDFVLAWADSSNT